MRRTVLVVLVAWALAGCLGSSPPGDGAAGNASAPGNGSAMPDETGNATPNGTGYEVGEVVAQGHIQAGSPTTYFCSLTVCADQEGIESFRMDEVPPPGTRVGTNTTDGTGTGYNLDLYFHDGDGSFLGGCDDRPPVGQPGDQTCEVPEDAASGTVDAAWGADLEVRVEVVELP